MHTHPKICCTVMEEPKKMFIVYKPFLQWQENDPGVLRLLIYFLQVLATKSDVHRLLAQC